MLNFKNYRNFLCLILITIFMCAVFEVKTKKLPCEKITIYDYINKITSKDCHMSETTTIDTPNMTILVRDNSMDALVIFGNKKVFYLPDKISFNYPNLKNCTASNCNIREVFRQNFFGLTTLTEINLRNNQIEKIASDTFEGLEALKELNLSKNRLHH
jgi:Leucine-rich repeat (LRR) protein